MSISGLELAGVVAGSIPIVGIPAGIIKFFVYLKKEKEYSDLMKKIDLEKLAKDVQIVKDQIIGNDVPHDVTADELKNQYRSDISNLKWYALAQAIPLVGIYFGQLEKGALERMNFFKEAIQEEEDLPIAKKPLGLSGLQLAGVVAGSIPIVSIPTGIIKSCVYLSKEKDGLEMVENRVDLGAVVQKTGNSSKQIKTNAKSDISNLKWYSLAQVIPLVGIYFAQLERVALSHLNLLKSNEIAPIKPDSDTE